MGSCASGPIEENRIIARANGSASAGNEAQQGGDRRPSQGQGKGGAIPAESAKLAPPTPNQHYIVGAEVGGNGSGNTANVGGGGTAPEGGSNAVAILTNLLQNDPNSADPNGFPPFPELIAAQNEDLMYEDAEEDHLHLEVGEMFTDNYRVMQLLGHGDIGSTYAVESVNTENVYCAIKLVSFRGRDDLMESVKDVQSKISRLQHDNVLSIYDVMENREHSTLVTISPLARRGNLFRYAGQVSTDPELLRKISMDIAAGLRVLHSYNIYHCSLKLEDVVEIRPNVFAISDAGFCQLYEACTLEALVAMDRLPLIPPEIFMTEDRSTLDKGKMDVWGLGILLYQLAFCLNPMRSSGSVAEVRELMATTTIPLPTNTFASNDFLEVIEKCLQKDPALRPNIQGVLRLNYFRNCNTSSTSLGARGGVNGRSFGSMSHMPKQASGTANQNEYFVLDAVIGKGVHGESFLVHLPTNAFTIAFKALSKAFSQRVQKHKADGDVDEFRRQIAVGRRARADGHPNVAGFLEFVDADVSSVTQHYHAKGNIAMNYPSHDAIQIAVIMINDILKGLQVLHSNDTYHCNLKPSNVFYGDEGTFVITDFGPVMNLPQEIVDHPSGCIYDVPEATKVLLKKQGSMAERLVGLKAIDTFAVGLLAASVVDVIRNTVFQQFLRAITTPVDVSAIMYTLREHSAWIDQNYINLVELALSGTATVEELLACEALRNDLIVPSNPPERYTITEKELKSAIKKRFEFGEEKRLQAVAGTRAHASMTPAAGVIEPHHRSNSYTSEQGLGVSGAHIQPPSNADEDDQRIEYLYQDDLKCSICQSIMKFVVFFAKSNCSIRCGKCVEVPPVVDLETMAVETVHHFVNFIEGQCIAVLLPITMVEDHVLEELEIKADLPAGTLKPKHTLLTTREISMARMKSVKHMARSVQATSLPAEHHVPDLGRMLDGNNNSSMGAGGGGMGLGASQSFTNNTSVPHHVSISNANQSVVIPDTMGTSIGAKMGCIPNGVEDVENWTADDVIKDAIKNRYTELALFALELEEVPPLIFVESFASLVTLDLSSNKLQFIPNLGCFTCLKTLKLSRNQLTELPSSIGDLPALEFLDVAHNQLSSLPQEIMFCDVLEHIIADYNDFDAIPDCIFDMPSIQAVLMAENKRINSWPSLDVIEGGMVERTELKITIDNKPSVYAAYLEFAKDVPKLTVNWNRIYPDCIAPNLYCGSLRSAQTQSVYEQLSIEYVLTMGRGLDPFIAPGMHHKTIIVDDIPNAKIDVSFDDAVDFVHEAISSGKGCLVHCFAGLSRSATAVIAYLMKRQKMRLDDAYALTKKGRPNIYPNDGFLKQLMGLDSELFPGERPLELERLQRGVIPT